jgi:N-glycosylase/DNA lyase
LWGKEAGWAHSVLFTADLKTFSDRVATKSEVKETKKTVKTEPDGSEIVQTTSRTRTTASSKRVKSESSEVLVREERLRKRVKRS